VNPELDSHEIEKRSRQYEKHDDPRISIFFGISMSDDLEFSGDQQYQ
jgi:hypothetical protein